ncbi:helix-turn-helix domain-containing protein [Enterobacter asburiae]|nr:helix-turn-helix domain-containing protein [Enterobacter asburiae]
MVLSFPVASLFTVWTLAPYSFCEALQCQPGDILAWEPDSPE